MKQVFRKVLPTALLALAASSMLSIADTNYYRWVDSRGNPVHSDRPPPKGIDYEVVSTQSTFTRAVTAEEGAVPPEVEPTVGNPFTPLDAADAERSKKNSELCERAKSNLEALTASDKISIRNEDGEVQELSPEELQVQRETAKTQIKVYCLQ